jgi:hypothetical protein
MVAQQCKVTDVGTTALQGTPPLNPQTMSVPRSTTHTTCFFFFFSVCFLFFPFLFYYYIKKISCFASFDSTKYAFDGPLLPACESEVAQCLLPSTKRQ